MLYGFPGNQESDEVKAPVAQPVEVLVSFRHRERPAHKGNASMVEEMLRQMGSSIRVPGDFAAAAQVDAAQKQSPAFIVYQPIVFNTQMDFTRYARKYNPETAVKSSYTPLLRI